MWKRAKVLLFSGAVDEAIWGGTVRGGLMSAILGLVGSFVGWLAHLPLVLLVPVAFAILAGSLAMLIILERLLRWVRSFRGTSITFFTSRDEMAAKGLAGCG